MTEQDVLEILSQVGAVITDSHIVYTSGRHGSAYVNKDAVYPHTETISRLCNAIAEQFSFGNFAGRDRPDVVVAPAVGGVILSQWTAHHLERFRSSRSRKEVLALYADKAEQGDSFVIKRGYEKLIPGKRVLVVEDILTTGGSAKKVVEAVRALGGEVVGLGAICNRGGVTAEQLANVPKLHTLVNVKLEDWAEEDCPLCRQDVPINTSVGKAREFLAKKAG